RSDDDVHVVALDQLLRLALRLRGLARRVGEIDLDLAPGEGVVALLEQQVDAFLHLAAAGGERAGAHGEEADAQRLALRERAAGGQRGRRRRGESEKQ